MTTERRWFTIDEPIALKVSPSTSGVAHSASFTSRTITLYEMVSPMKAVSGSTTQTTLCPRAVRHAMSTSAATRAFFKAHKDRFTVYKLPSYSPDYNPIEMLWKKVKEMGTHLHYFPTFQDLKDKVEETLLQFKIAK